MSEDLTGEQTNTAEERAPRRGAAMRALTAVQFFVGGLVLFVAMQVLLLIAPSAQEYDGGVTLIGWNIIGVMVAVPSMLGALIVGLPLRLVPAIRSRWLAHGEITVAGAVSGFIGCVVMVASGVMSDLSSTAGGSVPLWLLWAAWFVFAFSVAHFVWPVRWRSARSIARSRQSHTI